MKIGFGTMRNRIIDNQFDDIGSQIYEFGINLGINYFDTGFFYQNYKNEIAVSNIIDRCNAEAEVTLKLPAELIHSREEAINLINTQLGRITDKTKVINYFFHAVNRQKWRKILDLDLLSYLIELKENRRIDRIGFSFHDNFTIFEEIINYYDWDLCQIQLNYLDIDVQAGIKGLLLAQERNIPVITMGGLKGGLLVNPPENVKTYMKQVRPDLEYSHWGWLWLLSCPNIYKILSGFEHLEHIYEALMLFIDYDEGNITIPTEEQYDTVRQLFYSNQIINCTKCNYCAGCPKQIDIPLTFEAYNLYSIYNTPEATKNMTNINIENSFWKCISCGECVKKCPQQINIPMEFERMKAIWKK